MHYIVLISIVLFAFPAYGDVYSWTDANGVRHFGNVGPTQPAADLSREAEHQYDPIKDFENDLNRIRISEQHAARKRLEALEAERARMEAERLKAQKAQQEAEQARREAEAEKASAQKRRRQVAAHPVMVNPAVPGGPSYINPQSGFDQHGTLYLPQGGNMWLNTRTGQVQFAH